MHEPKVEMWVLDENTRRVAKVSGKIVASQFLPDHSDGFIDFGEGHRCHVSRVRVLQPFEIRERGLR
jgi:hypothetical protein